MEEVIGAVESALVKLIFNLNSFRFEKFCVLLSPCL